MRRDKNRGLFWPELKERGWLKSGKWSDTNVQREATRAELAEAYRLWVVHADIREERVK